jgi:hypothetical protein
VACNHSLATLRSGEFSAIIAVVKTLQQFDELWQDASPIEKKRLLRCAVSAASTQGLSLGQLYLSEAVYSLLCANSNCGSDGSSGFFVILRVRQKPPLGARALILVLHPLVYSSIDLVS